MSVWIISGLSGAGKQSALRALETAGFSCVDNLPLELLPAFVESPRNSDAAAVVDARQGRRLAGFTAVAGARVLFLDARDDVLVRRNAESTRPHPCADAGGGLSAVSAERDLLAAVRAAADVIIDTTELDPGALRTRIREAVGTDGASPQTLALTISSFGFKFGPAIDADWVIDARMIRNPFWVAELRPLTGHDVAVRDYVLADPAATQLVARLSDLLTWSTDRYRDHGRRYLHVAIGCTGGRHRSVVLAEALAEAMRQGDVTLTVRHRDVDKPDPR